jgi:hypothetical protein
MNQMLKIPKVTEIAEINTHLALYKCKKKCVIFFSVYVLAVIS